MSKRNNEGEVIFSQVAVGLAQQQQRLASLFGESVAPAAAPSHDEQPAGAEQTSNSLAELKGDGDDEGFGLGAIVPKEARDGSFTNRLPTSHERLLENLIGKKAAKAHLAAKQKHTAPSKPQKPVKPVETKEESDEEEGRAAAFQSKRQRRTRPVPTKADSSDDDEESRTLNLASKKQKTTGNAPGVANRDVTMGDAPDREDVDEPKKVAPASRLQKAKPKSYLDEILGEKSKKKKKKKGKSNDAKVDE